MTGNLKKEGKRSLGQRWRGGGGVLSDAWDLGWGVLGVYSEEGEDNLSEDAGDVRP